MNINGLLRLLTRKVGPRLLRQASAIAAQAGRKRSGDPETGQGQASPEGSRQQDAQMRQSRRAARQAMRALRRIGRM